MSSKYFNDVGCGFIPGRSIVNVFGNAIGVDAADTPCTLWPLKIPYIFPIAGEDWTIRSTSADDDLIGIGALTVAIDVLDPFYVPSTITVNLLGLTPVALPTNPNNFRVNGMRVVAAGSNHKNVGDIILEKIGGLGPTYEIILAGKSTAVAFVYTVPAGHNLWLPNFLFNMAKLGGGDVSWRSEALIHLPDETILTASTASLIQGGTAITVPAGFVITEKLTVEERVASVSANGLDINVQATGILTDLTAASVIQRLPTAWTSY